MEDCTTCQHRSSIISIVCVCGSITKAISILITVCDMLVKYIQQFTKCCPILLINRYRPALSELFSNVVFRSASVHIILILYYYKECIIR